MSSWYTYLEAGAQISSCANYRYTLWRTWDWKKPVLLFVMLNPSTGDTRRDDPTIRSCVRIADAHGYGGIMIVNLFAWRTTEPRDLPSELSKACGPDNARVVRRELRDADAVVCAWGASRRAREAETWIERLIEAVQPDKVYCLGRTSAGRPRHPLFVPAETAFEPYGDQQEAA